MKILLVDDDAFLRDMYVTKFREEGDEVDIAMTGEEAIKKLKGEQFDVVLLDMVMPGISGSDLLKEMKEKQLGGNPAAIVLSNQGEQENIEEAMSLGAKGYIVKAEMIPSEVVKKVKEITG